MQYLKDLGFTRGVNLGGWMSQCDYSEDRLERFITEADIAKIASWGLDHVRIPVDYNVFEDRDGGWKDAGFARLNRAVGWCRKHGLNAVIDLHKTAGFSFDMGEAEIGFFDSEAYQERFYRLWEELAKRCAGDSGHVAFELLNEVTEERFITVWNRISAECIRRIRRITPTHLILVGSYHNNSAHAVPALDPPADSRVIYNFHCYDPLRFTHQGARWVPELNNEKRLTYDQAEIPEDYFDDVFAPAVAAAEKNGAELYCGEYGVIDKARPEDVVEWYKHIHAAFEKYGISRCAWSYKQMDFGLSDERMDGVRDELIRYL